MNLKTTIKTVLKAALFISVLGTIVFGYLANRDIEKIYGGLTQRVDSSLLPYEAGPFLIKNANILNPTSTAFIADQQVLLHNGTIKAIGNEIGEDSLNRAKIIDAKGKYLIPGLTDSHVHFFKSKNDLLLYLANGITSVREMIGEREHLAWRAEINNGALGPNMFIASPRIGSFGALEGMFMKWSQGFLNINDPADVEKELSRLKSLGYDGVKIYSQISKPVYQEVSKQAKVMGLRVVGHVPWSVQMQDVYTRQDEIAHLEELMNAMNREFGNYDYGQETDFLNYVAQRAPEIAQKLAEKDTAVTTVLWLVESFERQKFELQDILSEVELDYENPGISEWTKNVPEGGLGWLPGVNRYQPTQKRSPEKQRASRRYWQTYAQACRLILNELIKAEVMILAGTDANLPPTVPGFSLHDEFISMNNAGMSNNDILKAATTSPAQWLGVNSGMIKTGLTADLVLLNDNPLINIAATRSIQSVFIGGKHLNRAALDEMLASVKTANDASRTRSIDEFHHHGH